MKKILFAFAIIMTMVLGASAQTDGFFSGDDGGYNNRASGLPIVPGDGVGSLTHDPNAYESPLGGGLLVLTALGAGYAIRRGKSRE